MLNYDESVHSGMVAFVILLLAIPAGYPNHHVVGNTHPFRRPIRKTLSIKSFERLDLLGFALCLGASLLLVTGLLEGGVQFAWSSGASISILVISGILWVLFLIWESIISSDKWKQEPVFPWRFLFNRPWMGILLYV